MASVTAVARLGLALLLAARGTHAMDLDITSQDSLKHAAFVVSHGMMSYYSGNESGQTPGYLPNEGQKDGYYWWEGSGVFGSLIDYWYYTGDTTYNDVTTQALLWQAGPDANYEPLNASQTLGNDDIGYWATSALKAAELNFPNPPSDQPQWIPLAQQVFDDFVGRWDTQTCNGGLHWQASIFSDGYHYKNSPANGVFFNIAARLGKYTNNQTYFDWAEKIWDWSYGVQLIGDDWIVDDGAGDEKNCTEITEKFWTYNQGAYMHGAACMYNSTNVDVWKTRTTNLLDALIQKYAPDQVLTEIFCQYSNSCNNDEKIFKSFTIMWMSEVAKIASYTEPTITPILEASAKGAAASCSGGSDGVTCGISWNSNNWDGSRGIGEQMTALEAFNSLLAKYAAGPLNNFVSGGTSVVAPVDSPKANGGLPEITTADRAGAGIVTFLLIVATLSTAFWMFTEGNPFKGGLFNGRVFDH